ncbi:Uncharacterised protein [Mycobacteroides abscessus subsp. abscessus]|nr:Uncharacterised protein [Mycobacteroides abscessus subsp. abscessus]
MMNDSEIAGPALSPAVDTVIVKMPAPITTETPKTSRSRHVRSLRSLWSGSSVSAIDCSTDLVRVNALAISGSPLHIWSALSGQHRRRIVRFSSDAGSEWTVIPRLDGVLTQPAFRLSRIHTLPTMPGM